MFKKKSIDQYFETIKVNYNQYLESKMVTYLALAGVENKKAIIDIYLDYIKTYRELEKNNLDDAIRNPTASEVLGRGAFSVLLGMSAGSAIFVGEQKLASGDLFGAKTATQGGFAAVIGASCSGLIYEAWSKSHEKPANADAKACEEQMKKAGFTESKYAELSTELVKLFYFRECLLDKSKTSMREAFKARYFSESSTQPFDNEDFNLSVGVYFLDQLNVLFHQAFQDIYRVQGQKIQSEVHDFEFIKWFRKYFETEKNRKKFTQQMQVGFMNECIRFLEKAMNQPGNIGKFALAFDSIIGLFVGAAATAVLAVMNPFMSILGLVCIGITSLLLAASVTHLVITHTDALYYKRDKSNREAIQTAIDGIQKEQNRLSLFLQNTIETEQQDINDLKAFDDENHSSFLKIIHWKGAEKHDIALGSVRGWIREFIHRFRESEFIGVDLSDRVKKIMEDSHEQSEQLKVALLKLMSSPKNSSSLKIWTQLIEDTKVYLLDPEHRQFIKSFRIVEKIREQILEVVGHISPTQSAQPLPASIVKFYTSPLSEGGLDGLASELNTARAMACIVPGNLAANEKHPYRRLLDAAFNINLKFNGLSENKYILQGDESYRQMLGFPGSHCTQIEDKLSTSNIQTYLSASFGFLYSLNQYDETHPKWSGAFHNSEQFILYRMLLVKQLTNLVDPNNVRVDPTVKKEIKIFVQQKLKCSSEIAFKDILSQSFLMTKPTDKKVIFDQLGHAHAISDLAYISDAIRVDIGYMSTPLAPQHLLAFAAEQHLKADNRQIILGYHPSSKLIAEFSEHFYSGLEDAIIATKAFIAVIRKQALLNQTGTMNTYISVVLREIDQISRQIKILTAAKATATANTPMKDALQQLTDFRMLLNKDFPKPKIKIKKPSGELMKKAEITIPPTNEKSTGLEEVAELANNIGESIEELLGITPSKDTKHQESVLEQIGEVFGLKPKSDGAEQSASKAEEAGTASIKRTKSSSLSKKKSSRNITSAPEHQETVFEKIEEAVGLKSKSDETLVQASKAEEAGTASIKRTKSSSNSKKKQSENTTPAPVAHQETVLERIEEVFGLQSKPDESSLENIKSAPVALQEIVLEQIEEIFGLQSKPDETSSENIIPAAVVHHETLIERIEENLGIKRPTIDASHSAAVDVDSHPDAEEKSSTGDAAVVHSLVSRETLFSPKKGTLSNAKYIAELEKYKVSEDKIATTEEKPSLGFFRSMLLRDQIGRGHKHSRQDKITSAAALKTALENIDSGTPVDSYDWSKEIFTTSKHLKVIVNAILREHKKDSLSALFSEHAPSQENVV